MEAQLCKLALRDAKDDVSLVVVREAVDTRLIVVEFDAGRGPGPPKKHTLAISIRDTHRRQCRRDSPRMASGEHRLY